jgi:hypothetical protein
VRTYAGQPPDGQPKFRPGDKYLSSAFFSRNHEFLSEYVRAR